MASSTTGTLRPLPILSDQWPLPDKAYAALREAKIATGYSGMVLPSQALPGSPGPVLAVGLEPGWLVRYAYVPDFGSVERLTAALTAVLINPDDPRIGDEVDLLSTWMGVDLIYKGEEEFSGYENEAAVPNERTRGWYGT